MKSLRYFNVKLLLVIIIALFYLPFVIAEDVDKKTELDKLLEISGYSRAFSALEDKTLLDLAKEWVTNPNEALSVDEQNVYMEQLRSTAIQSQVYGALQQNLSDKEIQYLLKFYENELMQRVMAAEKAALEVETLQRMNDFYLELRKQFPRKTRVQQIIDIIDVSLIVEARVFLIATVLREKIKAGLEYHNRFTAEERQKLDYHISGFKDSMTKNISNEMRVLTFYSYRNFSDDELTQIYHLFQDDKLLKLQSTFIDAMASSVAKGVNAGIKEMLSYREMPKI